jgi:hypothetical protein
MNKATMQVDHSTLKTAERIARERNCPVEDVVRDAVIEYLGVHANATTPAVPNEPETELPLSLLMPLSSRPVTIRIARRSTLSPAPIHSESKGAQKPQLSTVRRRECD